MSYIYYIHTLKETYKRDTQKNRDQEQGHKHQKRPTKEIFYIHLNLNMSIRTCYIHVIHTH